MTRGEQALHHSAREAARERLKPPAETPGLAELPLSVLRAYRRRLSEEEDRVSYWRRLVHARIDLLEAEQAGDSSMSLHTLARVLGDTGAGRTRSALVRVRATEPLPELPVLAEMWVTEVDRRDPAAVHSALQPLRAAEKQLTSYRTALHSRLAEATAELIARYRERPERALVALHGADAQDGAGS